MSRSIQNIHTIQAAGGLIFGICIAYVAYENYIDGRPDLAPSRIMLSLLLLAYSVSQLFIVSKSRVTLLKLSSFPFIYVAFGLIWEYSSRGYLKGWAPATHEAAMRLNLLYFITLSFIVGLAVLVTFRETGSANGT